MLEKRCKVDLARGEFLIVVCQDCRGEIHINQGQERTYGVPGQCPICRATLNEQVVRWGNQLLNAMADLRKTAGAGHVFLAVTEP